MKAFYHRSRGGLFLLEIILGILLFSVASAVCIQLFVKSHQISQRSRNVTMATASAQNAAELFKAYAHSPQALIAGLSPGEVRADGTMLVFYDARWNQLPTADDSAFVLHLQANTTVQPATAEIKVLAQPQSEEPLFSLTVKKAIL